MMTLGEALNYYGISQPTGRIVRFERRVLMSKAIWKNGLRNPRIWD